MKKTLLFALSVFSMSVAFAQPTDTAADLPYEYGFETSDLDQWLVTNEGTGNMWERAQASNSTPDASEGTYYMLYQFSENAANSYLYSRGLNLPANKELTLKFDYMGVDDWFPEKMAVTIGTAREVVAQTQELWRDEAIGNYPYNTATVKFMVPQDGVYYLAFRAFSDPDQFYLSVDNVKVYDASLGVNGEDSLKFSVFPSPASDLLTVSGEREITSLEIFDLSGKRVYHDQLKNKRAQIDIRHLAPGTYVGRAVYKDDVRSFKFIKK